MGGELGVDSALGRGSCFHFSLRLGLQTQPAVQRPSLDHESLRGARVLVVDDNACAREVLCSMAGALGLRADAAVDGLDALRRVALADESNDPYALLLLDWQMPVMDGLECARLLAQRAGSRHPTPAVLMLTAFSRDEVLRRLEQQQLPVGALLSKPVTPSTLFDACVTSLGVASLSPSRTVRREEALEVHRNSLSGARVLLVEDNAINRELAFELLSEAGILVSVACDGQEALEMLASQNFDCVLMDCQMPVMDGYTATRKLREQPRWEKLPVIALTANAMVGDRDKVLAAGMNDHIAKPIKIDEVFATIARWVRPEARRAAESAGGTGADANDDANVSLPGIDFQAGLDGLKGNRQLYGRLLRMFRDREGDFPARFVAARTAGDADTAQRMAHDLKGLAGSLAMHEVQQAAAALEEACRNAADETQVEALAQNVAQQLGTVMTGLQALDPDRPV